MKVSFKPANSEKVTLFANSTEAIVFWLCVAGLILFLITTLFRYYYLKPVVQEFKDGVKNIAPAVEIEERIDTLEAKRDSLQNRVDALLDSTNSLKEEIANLRSLQMKAPPPSPPKKKVFKLPIN